MCGHSSERPANARFTGRRECDRSSVLIVSQDFRQQEPQVDEFRRINHTAEDGAIVARPSGNFVIRIGPQTKTTTENDSGVEHGLRPEIARFGASIPG